MLAELPITFDKPYWLILLVLIVPAFLMARHSIGGISRTKAYLTLAFRVMVILLLTMALAEPHWSRRGKGLTVMMLIDRSQSIPADLKRNAVNFLREASQLKENDEDCIGVIAIAKDANVVAMPDRYSAVPDELDQGDLTATNLEEGVQLGMATAREDTATRFLLVSDGNETEGSVMAAAQLARANNIPIDVLPLEYEHRKEVIFEGITAQSRARLGQAIPVRMVLRSQSSVPGTLTLRMNGIDVDLNGPADGVGMHMTVEPGPATAIPVTINLDEPNAQRFEASFEPDNPADDFITSNNNAVAVTFVGGEGRVLVLDDGDTDSQYLIAALRQSNINVDRKVPEDALKDGAVGLASYDAVVMANINRHTIDDDQDRLVHAYVHDLGGGLVMLGGPDSFGAGGWIHSEVAKVLPVKLDPPQTRQMRNGALALVMHSCEMPQGNYWGQKVAIAAIQTLSRLDYVGMIAYGCPGWCFPLQTGDKAIAVDAAKKMQVGDMPDFDTPLLTALKDLVACNAAQKHVIVISDGDPSFSDTNNMIAQFQAANITITTVMVAGHGSPADNKKMGDIARSTGGNFHNVTNPNKLPGIFIKEAEMVSRSLIVEGDVYQPQVVSRLPGPIEGHSSVPAVDGYVLTAPREGLSQTPIVNATTEGTDPIYAYWNYGIGKSIAYTSDITGRWGSRWVTWNEFKTFWEHSIRWVMRPSAPSNMMVNTRIEEGDRAVVEVEALDADAGFMNFLKTNPVVLTPDGKAEPLTLQQVGPGRYRGEFGVHQQGSYLVNINYTGGTSESPVQGNVQAAVTVPYAREFRDIKHNAALLRLVAEATGGRELSLRDPIETVDLFNRDQLEVPRSGKRIWDLLAIIAASLFVVDVAARRLSIDGKALSALIARATGRRGEKGKQTVAAWKRARSQVAHRRDTAGAPAEVVDKSAKFQAAEGDKDLAIDVGSEIPIDKRGPASKIAPTRQAKEPEPSAEDADYTSRLLRAKRRARGEAEEPPAKDEGKPE